MEILKILLVSLILSIIPGQVLRLPFFLEYGAINLTDILAIITGIFFVCYHFTIKKTFKLSTGVFPIFLIFFIWVITSNIFSLTLFGLKQTLTSSFFLVRFLSYFFISQIILNSIKKEKVSNWINLITFVGFIFIVIGFLQLFILPDLNFLTAYGWDPHQKRIVSTILDPNFAGFIFVLIFIISTTKLLFSVKPGRYVLNRIQFYTLLASIFSIISVIFTFSRSSYLALVTAIFIIGLIKSPKMFFLTLSFLLISFFTIPQVKNRVIGAVALDDTAQARIISWENAILIFKSQPIFGVGFNNYRYAQAKYQLFEHPEQIELHSSSGSDSSILLVAATTGIVGLVLFLFLILTILLSVLRNTTNKPIKLITLSVLLALTVHSQFVNSFFFPQISLLFWIIFGLSQIEDV